MQCTFINKSKSLINKGIPYAAGVWPGVQDSPAWAGKGSGRCADEL